MLCLEENSRVNSEKLAFNNKTKTLKQKAFLLVFILKMCFYALRQFLKASESGPPAALWAHSACWRRRGGYHLLPWLMTVGLAGSNPTTMKECFPNPKWHPGKTWTTPVREHVYPKAILMFGYTASLGSFQQ